MVRPRPQPGERGTRFEAALSALLDAVRDAGPAGLRLREHAERTGVSLHTLQHRMATLARRQAVAIKAGGQVLPAAPRARDARWVIRPRPPAAGKLPRRGRPAWAWDDRGRSALVADATIDAAPPRIAREAYDARMLYGQAMQSPPGRATPAACAGRRAP